MGSVPAPSQPAVDGKYFCGFYLFSCWPTWLQWFCPTRHWFLPTCSSLRVQHLRYYDIICSEVRALFRTCLLLSLSIFSISSPQLRSDQGLHFSRAISKPKRRQWNQRNRIRRSSTKCLPPLKFWFYDIVTVWKCPRRSGWRGGWQDPKSSFLRGSELTFQTNAYCYCTLYDEIKL